MPNDTSTRVPSRRHPCDQRNAPQLPGACDPHEPPPSNSLTPLTDSSAFDVGTASVQGVRPENQDRSFAAVSSDGRRAVGAIADGIGGLQDGSGAAAAAIHAVRHFTDRFFAQEEIDPGLLRRRIEGLYEQANEAIVRNAGAPARSGTTLVLAVATEDRLFVANVGDSRGWLHADGGVRRLTADHSVVEELVRDGALSPEQAERSPYRNLLTRSLGDDVPEVDVVTLGEGEGGLQPGHSLLLTSDGTHGVAGILEEARIAGEISGGGSLDDIAARLCHAAVEAGSRDNASMVILRRS